MDVQRLILFGMVAAVFALVLKSMKSEWGQILSLAAALMIALYLLELCKEAGDFLLGIGRYVENASSYLRILLKAVGITYLCEFTANLSRDRGADRTMRENCGIAFRDPYSGFFAAGT